MKITAISDTHGQHEKLKLPQADILIHAGDVSKRGTEAQIKEFINWFSAQPHQHKIFIAGNHDFFFEQADETQLNEVIPSNIIYLNDSGIDINGIKIWGSPVQPWFHNWAFNRRRGEEIRKHWDLIPTQTDILITHGPVCGILDRTVYGQEVGCADLLEAVERIKPRVHICGHIHEAYGEKVVAQTRFINACVVNEDYFLVNSPVEFEITSQE